MEDKNEVQDFDLDDILNEFHETDPEEPVEVEADEELEELLHMPRLTITPVVVRTSDTVKELLEEAEPAVSREDTVVFQPLQMEKTAEGDTGVVPEAVTADTIAVPLEELTEDTTEVPETETPQEPAVEPAFEVEPEFVPEPILFQPKGAKLRELKKKLMDGPEKRFYELTETGTGRLQAAILANLLIVAGCMVITTLFAMNQLPVARLRLVIFSQVLAMLLSGLLGSHLMIDSLADLLKGKFSINTLLTLTFAACVADSLLCLRDLRVPCCAAFSLEMTFALMGRYQKRTTEMSQMDTMRKASRLNGIIKVEDYYEGKDGLLRREAQVEDFMETYHKVSGPELVQSIYAALSLVACIAIAAFAFVMHGLDLAVQILTTALLVAVPATFFVSVSRPMAILEKRFHMVGTLICGWESVKDLCGKAVFPLRDRDLFPKGSTKLNGVKFYGDRDPDEAVAYAAALIKAGGGGLVRVFEQLRTSRNAPEYTAENFQYYGNGGIGGEVCGEPVSVVRPTLDQEIFMRDRFKVGQHWHTLEGAFYFREGDYHYIIYSGNCYENEYYYLGYAVAKTSETDLTKIKFTKYPDENTYAPLISKNEYEEGTGHNSVIKYDGEYYVIYHGRDVIDDGRITGDKRTARICRLTLDGEKLTAVRDENKLV